VVLVSVATTIITPLGIAAWDRLNGSVGWRGLETSPLAAPVVGPPSTHVAMSAAPIAMTRLELE
jgi:hypothetical protein